VKPDRTGPFQGLTARSDGSPFTPGGFAARRAVPGPCRPERWR
jgi:hypothetical protein